MLVTIKNQSKAPQGIRHHDGEVRYLEPGKARRFTLEEEQIARYESMSNLLAVVQHPDADETDANDTEPPVPEPVVTDAPEGEGSDDDNAGAGDGKPWAKRGKKK